MSEFWSGLSNLFNGMISPSSSNVYQADAAHDQASMFGDNFAGGSGPTGGGNPWGNIGQELIKAAVPSLATGGVAMLANTLFPGQGNKVVGTDVRTGAGRRAEQARGGFSKLAGSELNKALADPTYGTLSPEMQARDQRQIQRQVRNADAARGMLETGGSARREADALAGYRRDREMERYKTINDRFSQGISGTQNFQPLHAQAFGAQENPWAKLMTGVADKAFQSKNVQQGIGDLVNRWFI